MFHLTASRNKVQPSIEEAAEKAQEQSSIKLRTSQAPSPSLKVSSRRKTKTTDSVFKHEAHKTTLAATVNRFRQNIKRLVPLSSVPSKVEEFMNHAADSNGGSDDQGWQPTRVDFVVFEIIRMFVLLVFLFQFTVSTVVELKLWQIYPIYGVFLLIEIIYKINTKRFVNGQIIVTKENLRSYYLKNTLVMDVIILPLIILEALDINCSIFKLIAAFKLQDIIDILEIIEILTCNTKRKSIAWDLVKNVCIHFLVAHCISLVLLGMTYSQQTNWLTVKNLHTAAWYQQYIWAFYWATTTMLTVGFGDFTATNKIEAVVVGMVQISSIIVLAYTISNIGDLIRQYRSQDTIKIKKIKEMNKYFKQNNLNIGLQEDVKHSLQNASDVIRNYNIQQQDKIVSELPTNLQRQIHLQTHYSKIRSLPLFHKLTGSSISQIACKIQRAVLFDKQVIIDKGLIPDTIFMLNHGNIAAKAVLKHRNQIVHIYSNDSNKYMFVGFTDILRQKPCKVRYQSKGFSTICSITKDSILETLINKPIDYQVFCFIRDQVAVQNNRQLEGGCDVCQNSIHTKLQCPRFHFCPAKSIVILRHIKNKTRCSVKQPRAQLQRISSSTKKIVSKFRVQTIKQRTGCETPCIRRVSTLKNKIKQQSLSGIKPTHQANEQLEVDKMAEFKVYFTKYNLSSMSQC